MERLLPRGWWILCFISLLTIGCASRVRPAPPSEWPAIFDDRQLYNTPAALIYSRNESAADEMEHRVNRVQGEFTKRTGGVVHKGLIIINDTDDLHLGDLTEAELLEKEPPKDLLEAGITRQELVMVQPMILENSRLTGRLGFSLQAVSTVGWAIAMPSERRARRFASRMTAAAMKQPDMNMGMRLLMIPFMPMVEGMVKDMVLSSLDVFIYTRLCDSQTDWDDRRRKQEAKAYENEKMQTMEQSLEATTRAATSMPAR